MDNLNVKEAYIAMFLFLDDLQKRTNSNDLNEFLGGMSFLADGSTADQAYWQDWLASVAKAKDDSNWHVANLDLT